MEQEECGRKRQLVREEGTSGWPALSLDGPIDWSVLDLVYVRGTLGPCVDRTTPAVRPTPRHRRTLMPYTAEISRAHPACFVFLIDQSGSMGDLFGSGEGSIRKADGVADAVNRALQNLCVRCAREEGVRNFFHLAVLGYGQGVRPAFSGALSGRELIPIKDIAENPAKVESRTKKVPDGAGGLVEQTVKFPIWFEPTVTGDTPMCAALYRATDIVKGWIDQHPNDFPPIVLNITDGESTDGDPSALATTLRSLASSDGEALLFNLHLSSQRAAPVEFPSDESRLPDDFARMLFRMSSPLPGPFLGPAREEKIPVTEGSRGFAFNADLSAVVKFLNIGTRPSGLSQAR